MISGLRAWTGALLLGAFVIDSPHCGTHQHDNAQLALAYLEEGRYEKALKEIKRAQRQQGEEATYYLIEAMAQLGQERIEAAVEALGKGLRIAPEDERLHQTLRDICRQEERYDLARDLLTDLYADYPDSPAIQAGLGWAHAELGEEEKGIELLTGAIDAGGEDLFPYRQLGRIYLDRNRLEEAVEVLDKALALDPEDQSLLLLLGETWLQRGIADSAAVHFERAVALSQTPRQTTGRIAQIYYDRGLRPQAIAYYEQALAYDPDDPLLLNNLAWTCAEEGVQLERALALSLRAVKMDADNVVYLDTYAELLYLENRLGQAIAVMRRALEIEPETGENYAYLRGQMDKFLQGRKLSMH